jgi:hypothetical protein
MPHHASALPHLSVVFVILLSVMTDGYPASSPFSPADADAAVREEMASRSVREAERKARLLEVPALEEVVVREGEEIVVLRRLAPQAPTTRAPAEGPVAAPERVRAPAPAPDRRPHKTLTLFITVFDYRISEIRSMHGQGGQATLTTLSNVDFSWFPGISTVESDSAVCTVLAFVERVNRDNDRSRPNPGIFSAYGPEYVVMSESDASAEARTDIDTVYRHYLENRAQFEADGRRALEMRAARERHAKENPPTSPQETVINFAPVRSRMHR